MKEKNMTCLQQIRYYVTNMRYSRVSCRQLGLSVWETIFKLTRPKGSCELLPSLGLRRKLFQKSSPLKVLDQWKPNLV
jgi:hypothetical protein